MIHIGHIIKEVMESQERTPTWLARKINCERCCYIGEEGAVFAAMKRLEETVDKLEARKEEESPFLDEMIMSEMLGEIRDIAQRGDISCSCGSKRWGLEVHYSSIELRCADCAGKLRLPAATMEDLADLCAKPRLVIRGGKS